MKKVKSKVKVVAMTSALAVGIAGFGASYMTNAEQQIESKDNSIQLNVEKLDRDTVKIYLSNFTDLAKSLQLSLKIDEGNVKFIDDAIKWISNEDENADTVKKNYKIDDSKKEIDFFILSDEPINSDGGIVEICEIDVSKDESIVEKLFKSASDGSYKIVPNEGNDEAYSYVTYNTNKRIGGNDIVNASDDKLTINTNPVINFKDSPAVVGDKIIIVKGTVFNIKDYVTAYDADGNEIENIEYTGKVENKKAGSYEIECKATDSLGDSTTLKITVIVEETVGNLTAPKLSVPQDAAIISVGDSFDPLDGVSAKDYQGRDIEVKVDDNYDTKTEGTYTLTYTATDYRGISATATRTLIVKAASDSGELPDNGGNVVPDDFEGVLDGVDVVSGNGTSTSPLLVDVNNLSSEQFAGFMSKLYNFDIKIQNVKIDSSKTYKIVDLRLTNKVSAINSESLFINSGEMYLSIRVDMANDELVNNIDSFIAQNGYDDSGTTEDSENSGGSGDSGNTGGSGGSDSSGGTGDSDNSGESGDSENTGGAGDSDNSGGTDDSNNSGDSNDSGNLSGNGGANVGNNSNGSNGSDSSSSGGADNSGSSNGSGTDDLTNSGSGTVNNNVSNNVVSDSTQAMGGNAGHGTEEADGQSSDVIEYASNDVVENGDAQAEENKELEKEEASDSDKNVDVVESKSDYGNNIGVIAGVFAGLAAIGAGVFYFWNKNKKK